MTRTLSSKDSLERNLGIISDFMREQDGKNVVQVFKDDTGTRRVLLGRGKNGFYGLKVSQPGVDVYDAEDNQLVFNSQQNVFKIVASDTTTIGSDGSTVTTREIEHGLTFTPIPLAFLNDVTITDVGANLSLPFPTFENLNIDTVNDVIQDRSRLFVSANATKLFITLLNATGSPIADLDVKYYLLQETAN
jgi:hypothetical protein